MNNWCWIWLSLWLFRVSGAVKSRQPYFPFPNLWFFSQRKIMIWKREIELSASAAHSPEKIINSTIFKFIRFDSIHSKHSKWPQNATNVLMTITDDQTWAKEKLPFFSTKCRKSTILGSRLVDPLCSMVLMQLLLEFSNEEHTTDSSEFTEIWFFWNYRKVERST